MLIVESFFVQEIQINTFFYFVIFILIFAQTLRWIAIYTLGKYWSIDVYEMNKHELITKGPYAYFRHPNYFAVVLEFFFLPLLLNCHLTLLVGSLFNLLILKRRIKMEEDALVRQI
jgi:methyltransferase